jgi:hypothetical protein
LGARSSESKKKQLLTGSVGCGIATAFMALVCGSGCGGWPVRAECPLPPFPSPAAVEESEQICHPTLSEDPDAPPCLSGRTGLYYFWREYEAWLSEYLERQ